MFRFTRSVIVLFLIAVAACGEEGSLDGPLGQDALDPALDISDAAHLPGRDGFFFLPPMVMAPTFSGTFDPGLAPVVKVCVLPACSQVIKTFNGGSGAEQVTVDVTGESYNALWNTKNNPANLQTGRDRYRLEVYVGSERLGYADLWFVNNAKGLKEVTGEYVGVVKGSPLTIKFRIETGVIGRIDVTPDPASILVGGTQQFAASALDLYDVPLSPQPAFDWSSSANGIATVNATGLATGVAAGSAAIRATAGGVTGSATLNVVRPPVLMDDDYTTNANTTLTVAAPGVLGNDDVGTPAGTMTSFGGLSLGGSVTDNVPGATVLFADGSVTLNANGSLSYTPATDFTGMVMFQYRVTNLAPDGFDDAVVVIQVIATGPLLANDAFTTATGTTLEGNLFDDNGHGADNLGVPAGTLESFGGGLLGGTVTSNPPGAVVTLAGGSLTVNANGSFSLVNPTTTGSFTFVYRVTNLSGFDDATVTIMIQMVPDAKNDAFVMNVGATLNEDVFVDNGNGPDHRGAPVADVASFGGGSLGGDASTNPAGTPVTLAGGTLSLAANGILSLANPTATGVFTFQYRLTNTAGSDDATVTIEVRAGPDAQNDDLVVNAGATLSANVTADNGHGADVLGTPAATVTSFGGGSLGGTVLTNAAGASVALAGGTLTLNANGSLTLTSPTATGTFTFQYRLTNAAGFDDATVTITVRAAPVAQNDAFTVLPNTTLNGDLFANNGSGADDRGFPLATVTSFGGGSLGGAVTDNAAGDDVALAGGTLTVNGDGSFSLVDPTTTGTFTFLYRITNAVGSSDATVTIEVARPPDAVNDAFTGTVGSPVSGDLNDDNGSGADDLGAPPATLTHFGGGSLGGAVTDNAAGASVTLAGGTLTVNGDGTFTLAAPTQGGVFTFLYRLTNSAGTDDAAVMITLNAPPTATDDAAAANSAPGDAFHTALNTTLTVGGNTPDLLANDTRGFPLADISSFGGGSAGGTVEGNAAGQTVNAADGSITVNADGSFTFTPTTGFTGLFTFSYRLENASGFSDATVTLAVGVRPAPNGDTYPTALVGNISINTATGTPFSVQTNDAGDALVLAIVGASATNGEATLNADGTFTFNPAAGFRNGNGTFQYTVSNGFGTSAPATVTIPVGTQVIWFIDNGAGACTTLAGGCGRLSNPFSTLAAFQAINALGTGNNPADNHQVFVYQSATGYTGGVTLRSGQRLIGQDATSTLLTLTGVTLPAHSPSLPAMNSGDATRTTFDGATGGITLNSGNHLHGFTASPSTGTGVLGASAGSLVVRDVAVNTASGPAVDLTGGTVDAIFTSVSSAGSATRGVNLDGISGTATLGSGSLAGSAGEALRINGGTANVAYSGSITNASNKSISIAGKTGGTVNLTGSIIDTGTGVELSTNTGATVRFAGGLSLSTGTNLAFAATGGGTVEICDENPCNPAATGALVNTITTTTGAALNVVNTNIGANNLEIRSIVAGTAAAGPASAIVLNNTGSAGGLKVKGTGSAGTGGTIQRTTGNAVSLTSTAQVSLSSVNITNNLGSGVFGDEVTGFSLIGSSVTNNGDTANGTEAGLRFNDLLGTSVITNSTITGSSEDNVRITPANSVLASLAISNSTIGSNSPATGGHGVSLIGTGTAQATLNVTGVTFTNNRSSAVLTNITDTGNFNVTVTGSTFRDNGAGVTLQSDQSADVTFSVTNNTEIVRSISNAIQLVAGSTSTPSSQIRGTISGNSIGNGAADSGSRDMFGIALDLRGDQDAVIAVNNNTVRNTDFEGIWVSSADFGSIAGPSAVFDLTLRNNTVGAPDDNSGFPIGFIRGTLVDVRHTTSTCVDMAGNASAGVGGAEHFRLRQRDTSLFRLERLSDGDATPNELINNVATIEAHIVAENQAGSTADALFVTGITEAANGACRKP